MKLKDEVFDYLLEVLEGLVEMGQQAAKELREDKEKRDAEKDEG